MARPTKQGVDYFPLDVYLDSKFKFIEIKYKLEGFAIIVKLFQKIYSCGYWCKFDDDEKLLFSDEVKADINLINDIINEAIARDIFDFDLYKRYEILTSKGVQKRYKEMVKRRKDVEIIEEYLLINGDFGVNASNNNNNVNNNAPSKKVNDSKSTQSKLKETKVNKTKVNKSINMVKSDPHDHTKAFEMFWNSYPKKVKKQVAIKWFEKNPPSAQLLTTMLMALEKFKRSDGWIKNKGQFIPDPTTWLNQKRWEDEFNVETMSREEQSFRNTMKELEGIQ